MNKEQRNFWKTLKEPYYNQVVITNNTELLKAIHYSKLYETTLNNLAVYIEHVAEVTGTRKKFNLYSFYDDIKQDAIVAMIMHYKKFDPSKSNNPYAYLSQICQSSFCRTISKHRTQEQIKKDFTERVKHGQT